MQYNLVGQHEDDTDPLLIGTFSTKDDAQTAADEATENDRNNNWRFYVEPVENDRNGFGRNHRREGLIF